MANSDLGKCAVSCLCYFMICLVCVHVTIPLKEVRFQSHWKICLSMNPLPRLRMNQQQNMSKDAQSNLPQTTNLPNTKELQIPGHTYSLLDRCVSCCFVSSTPKSEHKSLSFIAVRFTMRCGWPSEKGWKIYLPHAVFTETLNVWKFLHCILSTQPC